MAEKTHFSERTTDGHTYVYIETAKREMKRVKKIIKKPLGRLFELCLNNQMLKLAEIHADRLKLSQKKRNIFIKLFAMGFEWHNGFMIKNYIEKKGKNQKIYRLVYDFNKMCAYRSLKSDPKERERKRIEYQTTRSKGKRYEIGKYKKIAIVQEGIKDYIY